MMMCSPNIYYLDLDGVCLDTFKKMFEIHNKLDLYEKWPLGEEDKLKVIGMSKKQFWKPVLDLGVSFWANLDPYPYFEKLYKELSNRGKVIFCSSPILAPESLSGKVMWLQKRFGRGFKSYILMHYKHLLAKNCYTYLIDDFKINIDNFSGQAGNGILFPQKWNGLNIREEDKLDYILKEVDYAEHTTF